MILFTKTSNEDHIDVKRGLEYGLLRNGAYGSVSAMKIIPFRGFLGWHIQALPRNKDFRIFILLYQ